MTVLINGRKVFEGEDLSKYIPLNARYVRKKIDIGVDQSKTHSAIMVGPAGTRDYLDYIEILGEGGDTDVYDVCALTRKVCFDIFRDADIRYVGVEDPITKDTYYVDSNGQKRKKTTAMDTHENRLKLSAVFNNYMFIFYDLSGKHPMRVNNNDWKSGILPAEYRKTTHKKGSLDWHKDRGTFLAGTNDNVTDAACILDFVRKVHASEVVLREVDDIEIPSAKYGYCIIDYTEKAIAGGFAYNPKLSWENNITYVGNRRGSADVALLIVPIDYVPIEDLYKETCMVKQPTNGCVILVIGEED